MACFQEEPTAVADFPLITSRNSLFKRFPYKIILVHAQIGFLLVYHCRRCQRSSGWMNGCSIVTSCIYLTLLIVRNYGLIDVQLWRGMEKAGYFTGKGYHRLEWDLCLSYA